MFVLDLAEGLALVAAVLDASKEICSLLALEFTEPPHGLFGFACKPQVLRYTDHAIFPAVLFTTFVAGCPMHHLGKMRAGVLMRPKGLAFSSSVTVHRCDREQVILTPQDHRPHPADERRKL